MSIVHDFKGINSHLRGDDWWEPGKPEIGEEQSGAPSVVHVATPTRLRFHPCHSDCESAPATD